MSLVTPRLIRIMVTVMTLVMLPGFFTVARLRTMLQGDDGGEGRRVLTGPWQYRWETDTPSGPGEAPAADADGWRETPTSFDPPGRRPGSVLRLRRVLPAMALTDPALFTDLVLERFEVHLDGQRVYTFGNPGSPRGSFPGWPWHLIPLPEQFSGRTIDFRIWSDHQKIGIIGAPLLGARSTLQRRLVTSDIDKFVLGFIYLFLGSSLFFVFSDRNDIYNQCEIFSLAFFSVLMGLFSIAKAGSGVKQMLYDYPAFWSWLEIASLYCMPCTLLTYIMEIIGRSPVLRWFRTAHGVYALPALGLAAAGLVPLSRTVLPFQILFLASTAVTITLMIRAVRRDAPESIIMAAGITILGLFGTYDVLLAIGIVRSSVSFSHIGIFIFILSLYLVMARRVTAVTAQISRTAAEITEANLELESYKNTLEELVRERTRKLHETLRTVSTMNQELERLSITDELTGLVNRRHMERILATEWLRLARERQPLSLIMIDIDHFKDYNDAFGHQAGDATLAETARVLSAALRRTGDAVARYGGEEFLVIVPNTGIEGARAIAETMRAGVEALALKEPAVIQRTVTISAGVACQVPEGDRGYEAMIARADAALYRAKAAGRNRVAL